MSYRNVFIVVSADCPAACGETPKPKKDGKTKPGIEFELLTEHPPYTYTGDDLIYEVHIRHKEISEAELSMRGAEIREELFQKPHPCMRASMLPKKYGWGVHYNDEGKIALYPMESPEYGRFSAGAGGSVQVLMAMRNRKG